MRCGIELCDSRMRAHKRVDRKDGDREDNHRSEDANDFHDAIKIKERSNDNQNCADRASRPGRDSKLLLEVRSCAREHDEAHRKAREDQNDVNHATNQRRSDALEDLVMMARSIVGP